MAFPTLTLARLAPKLNEVWRVAHDPYIPLAKAVAEDSDVMTRLAEAKKECHSVDYGHLYWNPTTKTAYWVSADSDDSDTVESAHRKLAEVPGVNAVEGESESGPKPNTGWMRYRKDLDNWVPHITLKQLRD